MNILAFITWAIGLLLTSNSGENYDKGKIGDAISAGLGSFGFFIVTAALIIAANK